MTARTLAGGALNHERQPQQGLSPVGGGTGLNDGDLVGAADAQTSRGDAVVPLAGERTLSPP